MGGKALAAGGGVDLSTLSCRSVASLLEWMDNRRLVAAM